VERELASEMAAQMEWQRSLRAIGFTRSRWRGGRYRVFGDFRRCSAPGRLSVGYEDLSPSTYYLCFGDSLISKMFGHSFPVTNSRFRFGS
jgi:hypothetical protein